MTEYDSCFLIAYYLSLTSLLNTTKDNYSNNVKIEKNKCMTTEIFSIVVACLTSMHMWANT